MGRITNSRMDVKPAKATATKPTINELKKIRIASAKKSKAAMSKLKADTDEAVVNRVLRQLQVHQNPFLRKYDKEDKDAEWSDEDYQEAYDQAVRLQEHLRQIHNRLLNKTLKRAGNTHLRNGDNYSRHVDKEVKRILELYQFLFCQFDEKMISEILDNTTNTGNIAQSKSWVKDYRSQAQCATLLTLPRYSRTKQLFLLLGKLSDCVPISICANTFPFEYSSVDVERIFLSTDTDEGIAKWATLIGAKFINLALKTFERCVAYADLLTATRMERAVDDNKLFAYYKGHMTSTFVKQLDPGSIEDVPSRASRVDRGYVDKLVTDVQHEMAYFH